MNVKPLVLAGVATAVSVVTFVALNLIAPISHAQAAPDKGITAAQVFAGSIDEPGASAPQAASPEAAPTEVALADTGAGESAQPAAAEMEVAQADTSTPAPTESTESTAAASEPVSASGSCSTGIVDPNAKPVVVKAAGLPEDSAGSPAAESAPATASAPEPAMEMTASEPAPAPAPEFEAAPAVTAEPAPAPVSKPKPRAPKKAPAEAKVAWWPAKTPGKLNITYAGEASFTKAIVLMFDGAFDNADSANQNITVKPKKGGQVKGKWLVATGNKQMLLLDVAPGLYTVEVGAGLTDKGNRTIGAASSGAVFIH